MDEKSETRNLWSFFIITFFFSWALWIPKDLVSNHIIELPSVFLIITSFAAFGPLIAALLLTFRNEGKKGMKNLIKRCGDTSFRKIWFIPIFLLLPAVMCRALIMSMISGESFPQLFWLSDPFMIIVYFFMSCSWKGLYLKNMAGGICT